MSDARQAPHPSVVGPIASSMALEVSRHEAERPSAGANRPTTDPRARGLSIVPCATIQPDVPLLFGSVRARGNGAAGLIERCHAIRAGMTNEGKKQAHWRWVGPTVRRVRLSSWRNIAECDLRLAPLTVIVGRNGAGKSNFLDAFAFVAEALGNSVDAAVASRGGIEAVRRRSQGHPRSLAIKLEVRLPSWQLASYGFTVSEGDGGGLTVLGETATIHDDDGRLVASLKRDADRVVNASFPAPPPPRPGHLYLPRAAACGETFRALHDTLAAMAVFALPSGAGKQLRPSDGGMRLARDGANLSSVVARLAYSDPATLERVAAHLGALIPGVVSLEPTTIGPYVSIRFRQAVAGAQHPWKFTAGEAADGTLRALAVLIAAFQDTAGAGQPGVAGIEEPAVSLHPSTIPAMVDALREASKTTQIIATSHRPELIDALDPTRDALVLAIAEGGTARIETVRGPELRDPPKLDDDEPSPSPGSLLRDDELEAAPARDETSDQLGLF